MPQREPMWLTRRRASRSSTSRILLQRGRETTVLRTQGVGRMWTLFESRLVIQVHHDLTELLGALLEFLDTAAKDGEVIRESGGGCMDDQSCITSSQKAR